MKTDFFSGYNVAVETIYMLTTLCFLVYCVTKRFRVKKMYHQIFDLAHNGIFITNKSGKVLNANETFFKITGHKRDEIIGRRYFLFDCASYEINKSVEEIGCWHGEIFTIDSKNGDQIYTLASINRLSLEGETYYIGSIFDITAFKEQEKILRYVATHDQLTGLPNKSRFKELLENSIKNHKFDRFLAVLFIDFDDFKGINDRYGHIIGDAYLKRFSDRMSIALEDKGILARFSGDEFGVIVPNLKKKDDVLSVVNSFLRASSIGIDVDGFKNLKTTLSIGISFYPQIKGVTSEELIDQADQAMYIAKGEKDSSYFIYKKSQI